MNSVEIRNTFQLCTFVNIPWVIVNICLEPSYNDFTITLNPQCLTFHNFSPIFFISGPAEAHRHRMAF